LACLSSEDYRIRERHAARLVELAIGTLCNRRRKMFGEVSRHGLGELAADSVARYRKRKPCRNDTCRRNLRGRNSYATCAVTRRLSKNFEASGRAGNEIIGVRGAGDGSLIHVQGLGGHVSGGFDFLSSVALRVSRWPSKPLALPQTSIYPQTDPASPPSTSESRENLAKSPADKDPRPGSENGYRNPMD